MSSSEHVRHSRESGSVDATPAKAGVQRSSEISPALHSVESLRNSIPESYQSLFDTLRRAVIDFCDRHSIPTSSLNNDEALREATKHLSLSDLEHLSLVLKRLDYLVTHKEPLPEERVSLTEEQAREIMGENFLGTREVEEHFGELSDEQQEILSIIPFSKETLKACAQTHILVADIGSSILDIRDVKSPKDKKLFFEQYWYNNKAFAKRTESARWRLIRKTSVEDSFGKTRYEQRILINQETDDIPLARQVIYTMTLNFLVTKERLFNTCVIRTSDVDSVGNHIRVGYFGGDGLHISRCHDNDQEGHIGVTSARKVDS